MPEFTVPVSQITVDPALQPRVAGLDAEHVQVLEQCADAWPPLQVVRRDGRYVLIDGAHRLAAAQNLDLATVRVVELPPPDDGDLTRLAFAANQSHGLPLTLADRRARAEHLLTAHPLASNLEVARQVTLSPTTVAAIRERLEHAATIAPTTRRVARDGATYTVVAANAGRAPGQLPAAPLSPFAAVTSLFTPEERKGQRAVAGYLQRLATALDDQYRLNGWETAEDAATACRAVLGDERAAALGNQLGAACEDIIDVALVLSGNRGR